jgi:hypothetical protein
MPARWQVAFLTGQSDPQSCALSPVQRRFLDSLAAPVTVDGNFPYATPTREFRTTPLLRASFNNARQYLRSRRPAFRDAYRTAMEALLARSDRTLLLAGSCGLELFNNLELSREQLDRCAVFAYGPVARRRPDCDHRLLQGRHDALSRWYFPRVDVRVDAGHMDYLDNSTVLQHCRAWFMQLQSRA